MTAEYTDKLIREARTEVIEWTRGWLIGAGVAVSEVDRYALEVALAVGDSPAPEPACEECGRTEELHGSEWWGHEFRSDCVTTFDDDIQVHLLWDEAAGRSHVV